MSGRVSRLFTWRSVLNDADDLTLTEYAVGHAIATFMNEAGDGAWPAVATLARCAKCSPSTVREAIKGLERKGYLEVRRATGRGHTNTYTARQPDPETHREPVPSLRCDDAAQTSPGGPDSPSPATAGGAAPGVLERAETHREPVAFGGGEGTGSPTERHRLTAGKTPGAGADHVRTTPRPRQQQQSDPAAAVDLELLELRGRLTGHGIDGELLRQALAEPERAAAWIDLAERDADLNVGGYFRAGFQQGGMPGPRVAAPLSASASPIERATHRVRQLITNLGVEHGPDEARHYIDHEAPEALTAIERSELHQLADELVSALLPDGVPASPAVPQGVASA